MQLWICLNAVKRKTLTLIRCLFFIQLNYIWWMKSSLILFFLIFESFSWCCTVLINYEFQGFLKIELQPTRKNGALQDNGTVFELFGQLQSLLTPWRSNALWFLFVFLHFSIGGQCFFNLDCFYSWTQSDVMNTSPPHDESSSRLTARTRPDFSFLTMVFNSVYKWYLRKKSKHETEKQRNVRGHCV